MDAKNRSIARLRRDFGVPFTRIHPDRNCVHDRSHYAWLGAIGSSKHKYPPPNIKDADIGGNGFSRRFEGSAERALLLPEIPLP